MQHKQTRQLYALKYINKSKCVKMKAVANIIQERRILEEVCCISTECSLEAYYAFASTSPSLNRSTIPSLSICVLPSKTTKTASLFSISCWVVICDVRIRSSLFRMARAAQSGCRLLNLKRTRMHQWCIIALCSRSSDRALG